MYSIRDTSKKKKNKVVKIVATFCNSIAHCMFTLNKKRCQPQDLSFFTSAEHFTAVALLY